MKIFFTLLIAVLLPIGTKSQCQYGCTCYDDSNCAYYCDLNQNTCQRALFPGSRCSGYYIHPRECGDGFYCDSNSGLTCQSQKRNGETCMYSYSCLSGNCDYKTNTCQSNHISPNWLIPILSLSILVFVILFIIFVAIAARRQRWQRLQYYRNPYVVLPSGSTYSYQNSCVVTETLPPPYPGTTSTPLPYAYPN